MSEQQYQDQVMAELEQEESKPEPTPRVITKTRFREIWRTLSAIDVSDQVEIKGSGNFQLKYLSWAWAWGVLMEKYPNSTYQFKAPVYFENGTCEVWVTVNIAGSEREMWLPVMDHKNKAIVKPDARAISDARMRCLVKCLAMFGLGHYIYAGEDLPKDISGSIHRITEPQYDRLTDLIAATDSSAQAMCKFYGVNALSELNENSADDAIAKLEQKQKETK